MMEGFDVVILGAGESGIGAALLAKKNGLKVVVSEYGKIKTAFVNELLTNNIPFEEGGHNIEILENTNCVVKSPGIPNTAAIIVALKAKGIKVISEIEFAAGYTKHFIIGITGSNGKTTTTNLTHHLLVSSGLDAVKCGNVGKSFARQIAEREANIFVVELSSFQLDDIDQFKPNVAIMLNISPDHLDRYEYKLENYVAAKFRICKNQDKEDLFIYNDKDEEISKYMESHSINAHLHPIGNTYYQEGKLIADQQLFFDTNKLSIQGKHNMQNSICAIAAALSVGAVHEGIQKGLDTFINDPHRMEKVLELDNVEFINDSKATNVDSVFYALDAIEKPIIWVVGGKDKGNDYEPLMDLVRMKVKAIICLGEDNSKLLETFSSQVKIMEDTNDVDTAIELAATYAEAGDVVLLSPACASFDLFDNYKHRGDEFRRAVLALKEK